MSDSQGAAGDESKAEDDVKSEADDDAKSAADDATEGAQAAENPQAAEGPEGTAGQQPKSDVEAAEKVQESAEKAESGEPGAESKDQAEVAAGSEEGEGEEPETEVQQETLHGQPLVDSLGQAVVHTDREGYLELCQALRADGYDLMVGVTAVDYLVHPGRPLPPGITPERFEVVVELASVSGGELATIGPTTHRRVRVRCQVPGDDPTVPSLFDVWPGTEAHERETYDMYGIVFDGHPDPSRILMPEDWEGHPLRKDYATGRIPVQFKESPGGR